MRKFYLFAVSVLLLLSCSVDEYPSENKNEDVVSEMSNGNVLTFGSTYELNSVLEMLKASSARDLREIPLTKSMEQIANGGDFVSLRQELINKGLREFTDDELRMIEEEGLTYEPEDSLILDPDFCAVLNNEREIIVGSTAYRYIKDGVIECDADNIDDMPLLERAIGEKVDIDSCEEGVKVPVEGGSFTKLDYEKEIEISNDASLSKSGDNWREVQPPSDNQGDGKVPGIKPEGNTLVLDDGTIIQSDKINTVKYIQDESEASAFQRFISSKFGTNVVANNYFDSKHRMRLRLYSQDYIICSSVGMVTRMQKKKLGIWWNKKTDEFRYGWSAIECKYDYSQSPFQGSLPSTSNGTVQNKYPDFVIKNVPFKDKNVVLFHIGLLNYDFTTGDINKMFSSGIEKVKDKIQAFVQSEDTKQYKDAQHGLFTVDKNDLTVYVTFPQFETVKYNTRRESHEWDFRWFSGKFVIGFSSNMVNSLSLSSLDITPLNNVDITRGCVYSAVKYNGEWRACVIKTEN